MAAQRKSRSLLIAFLVCLTVGLLLLIPGARPQTPPNSAQQPLVKRITTLTDRGGRVDWGPNNLIAFDRLGDNQIFDIWVMHPDGSGQACLTCGKPGLPQNHRGNPAWHPSGKYIVFQVAQESAKQPAGNDPSKGVRQRLAFIVEQGSRPGGGYRNDLWIMDPQANHFWKLTNEPWAGGVLHPHFSHDGKHLFWAERLSHGSGIWGIWSLHVADFSFAGGTPALSNIQTLPPGSPPKFFESHGFDPTDSKLIFTSNTENGPDPGLDIYTYDLKTKAITNLTHSPQVWDEHAHYSPSGRTIIWASSEGHPLPEGRKWTSELRLDLWTMNPDGSGKQKITHFADQGSSEYEPRRTVAADSSWSPDGTRVVGLAQFNPLTGLAKIFLVEFSHPM